MVDEAFLDLRVNFDGECCCNLYVLCMSLPGFLPENDVLAGSGLCLKRTFLPLDSAATE